MRCQLGPQGRNTVPRGFVTDGGYTVEYVPCGVCLGCRIERRQELTLLQMAEASLHEDNWFLTLTYDDARCDFDPMFVGLQPEHLQKFTESMRLACKYRGVRFRFFACGEYGDEFGRPHYHLSLFGVPADFLGLEDSDSLKSDRFASILVDGRFAKYKNAQVDENGNFFWFSDVIANRWPYGNHQLYRANRKTFQYVAGYVTKKLLGKSRRDMIASGRYPSFHRQSRPSIGYYWWLKYKDTLSQIDGVKLVNDKLSLQGVDWKVPRIMNRWLKYYFPLVDYDAISSRRLADAPKSPQWSELERKKIYTEYRARCMKTNNTHKEIQ